MNALKIYDDEGWAALSDKEKATWFGTLAKVHESMAAGFDKRHAEVHADAAREARRTAQDFWSKPQVGRCCNRDSGR